MSRAPILRRIASDVPRDEIAFALDGRACTGLEGDTVLAAILVQGERLRESDFSSAPRAGFCLMGACQDCWVQLESGERLRACTTMLVPGMQVVTGMRR
ncbi:MAG: (2Fe-2S)-binding protein [Burkholderiales bacterium]|nr:(2Fe-2S)-binding protein [Burkholderiales bacterium]